MLSRINLFKSLYAFLFFISNFSFSQVEAIVIDEEGWAKGNYIEIGIGVPGSFGAKTENKPLSFHDNRETENNQFGFIANPQKDGWIDYDGDYFTPGIAEEGFNLEINGVNYSNNTNPRNVSFDVVGKVISASRLLSSCYDDYSQLIWEGEVNGLIVKRFYNVTLDGLFIKMSTIIYNTSRETKRNVFFMHSVDPDNNQVISNPYDFNTDLRLISQGYSANQISLVTASQPPSLRGDDADGSTVSFYALDSRSRVSYGGFFNRMASDVWNGISFTTDEGSFKTNADEAISIAFKLGDMAPGENSVFAYYYILEAIDESFDPPPVINISNVNTGRCETNTGEIIFIGLDANTDYGIEYQFDDALIPQEIYTSDDDGKIIISNLFPGIYSDFAFTDTFCENRINAQIEITTIETSFTAELKVKSKLFALNNSVDVIVNGNDEYEFRLDDGAYQASNSFDNIGYGLHKFYVRNIDDCQEIILEKTFLSYPRFFTPNGDSINDTWSIRTSESLQVLKVLIYDRYGKLLKQLDSSSSWDGIFNGSLMPTGGYWFSLYYSEIDGSDTIKRRYNGHFALKR